MTTQSAGITLYSLAGTIQPLAGTISLTQQRHRAIHAWPRSVFMLQWNILKAAFLTPPILSDGFVSQEAQEEEKEYRSREVWNIGERESRICLKIDHMRLGICMFIAKER